MRFIDTRGSSAASERRRLRAAAGALALAAAVLAAAPVGLPAQSPSAETLADSLDEGITRAGYGGDLDRLEELRLLAERGTEAYPNHGWPPYYRAYVLYRMGTLHLVLEEDVDRAERLLEEAQALLERAVREESTADAHALLAGVLGLRISVNPISRGTSLGPAADRHVETALELDRRNPRVWLIRGVSAYNTPPAFGGGMEKARRFLEKSLRLFRDADVEPPAPAWGEAEARAWIGRVHEARGETKEARTAYREALRLAPGYDWVRYELLPRVAGGDGGESG